MKRILIYGLKDPIGGVENVVLSYTERFPSEEIVCDYLLFGTSFSQEPSITARGGKVYYLPHRVRQRAAYRRALHAVFQTHTYDAVWVNLAGLTNIDVLRFAKAYGVPVRIAHSHGTRLYWSGLLMRFLVPLFHYLHKPFIARYATHFWGCSQPAGEFLFPRTVHDRLTVLHNAVDTAVFCADAERRSAMRRSLRLENATVIGHVARLSPEKNQGFLLDVFEQIHQQFPETRLLIVGDGECREALQEKAAQLHITDCVLFCGFQSETADYYRACDVFVLPSLSEGLGISLIEAQACGVPCVASAAVPREADVTDAVRFIGLDEPLSVWCKAITEQFGRTIPDAAQRIQKAEYDLATESKKLQEFFKR
ncbi:MAG: glycosyltransferase [Clostridia bacterium]|nr:glycosyltransferase [Clostridia bacterium]